MFTFALAFFAGHRFFFFSFSTSFRFSREEEEGIWKKAFTMTTTDHNVHMSDVKWQTDRFACSAAYFSSFPKENAFQSLEENLWTINAKTEFPDFPWPWQPCGGYHWETVKKKLFVIQTAGITREIESTWYMYYKNKTLFFHYIYNELNGVTTYFSSHWWDQIIVHI